MHQSYWRKQTSAQPLFPDLIWSRPEGKRNAGKLLIIGGNVQSFAAPAEAYNLAQEAGAGSIRVLLPDSLQTAMKPLFPDALFAPSNPSGSFARNALESMLTEAVWADGVLLAGDIGRNSETVATLEAFLNKFSGQITLTRDIADEFCSKPTAITARPDTVLVVSMGQLMRLGQQLRLPYAFTTSLSLMSLVERLHKLTLTHPFGLITIQHEVLVVAWNGRVATSPRPPLKRWRLQTAAAASTWWLQFSSKPFEALSSSLWAETP